MERHTGPLFEAAYAAQRTYLETCALRNERASNAWTRYGAAVTAVKLGRRASVAPRTVARWEAHQRADERLAAQCVAKLETFNLLWKMAVRDRYGCEPGQVGVTEAIALIEL